MKADEAGFSASSRDAAWTLTLGSSLATRQSQNLYVALAGPSIIAWARMTTLMMNLAVVGCGWFKVVIRSQSLAGLGCLRAARKGLPGATSCLSTDWIRICAAQLAAGTELGHPPGASTPPLSRAGKLSWLACLMLGAVCQRIVSCIVSKLTILQTGSDTSNLKQPRRRNNRVVATVRV